MTITEEKNGKVVVLGLNGMIHSEGSRALFEKIAEVIERGERYLLLDFTEVNYINSSGLSALLQATKKLGGAGGKLVLAGVNDPIKRIFEISGLTPILTVCSTNVEALGSFR